MIDKFANHDYKDDVVLVTVHPAQEVLPDSKIPDLDDGEAMVLQSDANKPFRMLVTMEDWVKAMMSVNGVAENDEQPASSGGGPDGDLDE